MKVKLLKDHGVLGLKDDVVEVTDDQANYLNRVKAATEHKEDFNSADAEDVIEHQEGLEMEEVTEDNSTEPEKPEQKEDKKPRGRKKKIDKEATNRKTK